MVIYFHCLFVLFLSVTILFVVFLFTHQQNTTLLSLNLHDNYLEGEGGAAIAAMLKENCYITELVGMS